MLENVFKAINEIDLAQIPMLTSAEKKSLRIALRNKIPHFDNGFSKIFKQFKYYDPSDTTLDLLNIPHEIVFPTHFMGILFIYFQD